MLFVYIEWQHVAVYCFGIALLLLSISLYLSIREILISTKALEIHLDGMRKETSLPPDKEDRPE
jgi:threonine/homoserine efflux transporter RhtA